MKQKVIISPCPIFVPGTVQKILAELGSGPIQVDAFGRVHAELTASQLELFRLKGAAHGIQLVEDSAPVVQEQAPAATFPETETEKGELTITIETSPGVRQTMKIGPQGLEPVAEIHKGAKTA